MLLRLINVCLWVKTEFLTCFPSRVRYPGKAKGYLAKWHVKNPGVYWSLNHWVFLMQLLQSTFTGSNNSPGWASALTAHCALAAKEARDDSKLCALCSPSCDCCKRVSGSIDASGVWCVFISMSSLYHAQLHTVHGCTDAHALCCICSSKLQHHYYTKWPTKILPRM